MRAIKYLNQIKKLDELINRKVRTSEHWREMAYNISVDYKEECINKSHATNAPFEKCIERADELEREVSADTDRLAELKIEVEEKISLIEDEACQDVLRLRYIELMLWEDVIASMDKSRSHVFRKHSKALRQMEQILQNETK